MVVLFGIVEVVGVFRGVEVGGAGGQGGVGAGDLNAGGRDAGAVRRDGGGVVGVDRRALQPVGDEEQHVGLPHHGW